MASPPTVITNTTPLINFAEVGCLDHPFQGLRFDCFLVVW